MFSFELKLPIATLPSKVFVTLTDPAQIVKWDGSRWVQNDMRLTGTLRKRDDHGDLHEGEIVAFTPPFAFAYLWPVPKDSDEPEEGTFPVRFEFRIDATGDQSMLILTVQGFPTEELAARERNTWGGYFLEKIKKVAEQP